MKTQTAELELRNSNSGSVAEAAGLQRDGHSQTLTTSATGIGVPDFDVAHSDLHFGSLSRRELHHCLQLMEQQGFSEGLRQFIKSLPDAQKEGLDCYVQGVGPLPFQPLLPCLQGLTALDISAGWGAVAVALASQCRHVTALGLMREPLRALDYRRQELALDNMALVCGSQDGLLPFGDDQFDLVTLIGVLQYVGLTAQDTPQRAQVRMLREIYRVLRPGGMALFANENRFSLDRLRGFPDPYLGLPYISLLPRFLAKWLAGKRNQNSKILTHGPGGYRRLLKKTGFGSPMFFVSHTDYRRPTRITPGTGLSWAGRAGVLPNSTSGGPLIKKLARGFINFTGGLPWKLQEGFLIAAVKNGTYEPELKNIIEDVGKEVGGRWQFQWVRVSTNGTCIASLQRSEHNQRVLVRVPLHKAAVDLLQVGTLVQQALKAKLPNRPQGRPLIPAVSKQRLRTGVEFYLEEVLPGHSAEPGERDSKWFSQAVEFAATLRETGVEMAAQECRANLRDVIESFRPASQRVSAVVDPFFRRACDELEKSQWPLSAVHGDFNAENLLVDPRGAVTGVVDWEFASPAMPAGYDMMYFLVRLRLDRLGIRWDKFAFSRDEMSSFLTPHEQRILEAHWNACGLPCETQAWFALQAVCWLSDLEVWEWSDYRSGTQQMDAVVDKAAGWLARRWPS